MKRRCWPLHQEFALDARIRRTSSVPRIVMSDAIAKTAQKAGSAAVQRCMHPVALRHSAYANRFMSAHAAVARWKSKSRSNLEVRPRSSRTLASAHGFNVARTAAASGASANCSPSTTTRSSSRFRRQYAALRRAAMRRIFGSHRAAPETSGLQSHRLFQRHGHDHGCYSGRHFRRAHRRLRQHRKHGRQPRRLCRARGTAMRDLRTARTDHCRETRAEHGLRRRHLRD